MNAFEQRRRERTVPPVAHSGAYAFVLPRQPHETLDESDLSPTEQRDLQRELHPMLRTVADLQRELGLDR